MSDLPPAYGGCYDPPLDEDYDDPYFDGGGKLGSGAANARKRKAKAGIKRGPAKKEKKTRAKDEKKSQTAKKRELDKFKCWLPAQKGYVLQLRCYCAWI